MATSSHKAFRAALFGRDLAAELDCPGPDPGWVLDVDGHADDSWQVSFETRQVQAASGVRG